jgi:hypothetical protein
MSSLVIRKRKSLTAFWLFGMVNCLKGAQHDKAWTLASHDAKEWFKAKEIKGETASFPATVQVQAPDFAAPATVQLQAPAVAAVARPAQGSRSESCDGGQRKDQVAMSNLTLSLPAY